MADCTDPIATVIYDGTEIQVLGRSTSPRTYMRARMTYTPLMEAMLRAPPWLVELLAPVAFDLYKRKPDLFVTVEPVIPNG